MVLKQTTKSVKAKNDATKTKKGEQGSGFHRVNSQNGGEGGVLPEPAGQEGQRWSEGGCTWRANNI